MPTTTHRTPIWLDRYHSGLVALLHDCTISRHGSECWPGLWHVEAKVGAHILSFLGRWLPPSADAVVDDFGTLVRVPE